MAGSVKSLVFSDQPEQRVRMSSDEYGFQTILGPENSMLRQLRIYRLNLREGNTYGIRPRDEGWEIIVAEGELDLSFDSITFRLRPLDAFYVPYRTEASLTARKDLVLFAVGAPASRKDPYLVRTFERDLPYGPLHGRFGRESEQYLALAPDENSAGLSCDILAIEDRDEAMPAAEEGEEAVLVGLRTADGSTAGTDGEEVALQQGSCIVLSSGAPTGITVPGGESFFLLARFLP